METVTTDINMASLLLVTAALLVAIMGSTLTIVTLMFRQSSRHETSIKSVNASVASLGTKVSVLETKVDALDGKVDALDGKFDVMGRDVSDSRERLARVEGHLMAPEGFRLSGPQPPAAVDAPPPEDPGPDQRQAG